MTINLQSGPFEIVARLETERAIVQGNRELIHLYEEKVKKVIERVWEECPCLCDDPGTCARGR